MVLRLSVVTIFVATYVIKSTVVSVRVNCEFKYFPWPIIGNSYTCHARNFNVTLPEQFILKVSGDHRKGLSDSFVRALDISRETCHFLPQRIKNFFPNLEVLQVHNSKLKSISQVDLKPLAKLRVLHLHANNLESLENNLFDFNVELVRIDFRYQSFKQIGYNLLDNLRKLAIADFQFSGCVDFFAPTGRKEINELKKEIRINCQPLDDMIKEIAALKQKVSDLEKSNTEANEKMKLLDFQDDPMFAKIDAKFSQMHDDNEKCIEGLNVVVKNFYQLVDKIDVIEKTLRENSTQSCKIDEINNKKCLMETEQLQRIKRELSVIDVECEKSEWLADNIRACNVRNLRVVQPDMEIERVLVGSQKVDTSNIQELKVFNQQTIYLPLRISENFKHLKVLSFIDCGLTTLRGEALDGLTELETLVLTYNKIGDIPSLAFKNLMTLVTLDLSHNSIRTIGDDTFKPLVNLSVLKLNNNLLSELSSVAFHNFTKLKFLFVQHNRLNAIPSDLLEPLKVLEFVDFSNNECIDIAASRTTVIPINSLREYLKNNCKAL